MTDVLPTTLASGPVDELLGDRALRTWQSLRARWYGTATLVAGVLAVVALWCASRPRVVEIPGARLRCGLDVVAFGHPDAEIATACREGSGWPSLLLAVVAGMVGVAVTAVLLELWLRRSRDHDGPLARVWAAVRATTLDRVLLLVVVLLGVATIATASPRSFLHAEGGSVPAGRCGIDSLVFDHPDAAVDAICHDLLDGRVRLLVPAAAGFLAALALLATRVLRRAFAADTGLGAIGRHRAVPTLLALGAAALVLAVLGGRSVVIQIEGPPAQVVRCGPETWVLGGPTPASRTACREAVGAQVATSAAAGVVALVAALHLVAIARRRDMGEAT